MALLKNRRPVQELNPAAVSDLLNHLRSLRISSDVYAEFELESLPRNQPTRRMSGSLAWSWNESGMVQRLSLSVPSKSSSDGFVKEWILHNGIHAKAWTRSGVGAFERMNASAMLQPLTPSSLFSVFDLLMPFIQWHAFNYEGAGRLSGREAHFISMLAPPNSPYLKLVPKVTLALDSEYALPLSVKRFDADGELQWVQKIESFRKFDGHYFPKKFLIKSISTGDRERIVMHDIKLMDALDHKLFDPTSVSPLTK